MPIKKSKLKKSKESKDSFKTKNILPSNFNKELSKKNNLKMLKGVIYTTLIINIIFIIYLSSIIYYLNKLKECQCFLDKNKSNYSNINYLILIESILLAFQIIAFLSIVYVIYMINNAKIGGGKDTIITAYIIFSILFLIYGFFVYYVFKLSENISDDCSCSKSWLRYLLYIQTFFIILSLVGNGYTLLNTKF
jgi:uncharacterized membrane protein YozB (DUF420 family)